MAKAKWLIKMRRKRKRMVKKMKITFWRLAGALGVITLFITLGGSVGMQIGNTLSNLSPDIWNGAIFISASVIGFIGLMYLWGLWQQRQLVDSEIDLKKAEAEAKRGKAEREYSGADKNRAEADNSRVRTAAEVKVVEVEADIKRQEVVGKQIENAKAAVDVELSKVLLDRAPALIDKVLDSPVPYALNAPGAFTLTAKVPRSITNNNSAGEIGSGDQERRINFIDHIRERRFNRIGLIGAQGGGKTTALRWYADLLNEMRPGGMKFVLDPHAPPHKWPSNFRVIGAGRNYFEIAKFFVWLFTEAIPTRYAHRAEGKTDFSPVDILSDEWVTIVANMKETEIWNDKNVLALFTEPRKINIGMALCLHDTTNKSFGISSGASLKGALQANFYFEEDAMTGERIAKLGVGIPNKTTITYYPCDMPGPYPDRFHSKDATEQEADRWAKANETRIKRLQLAPASGDVMDLSDFIISQPKKNKKKATDEEVEAAVSEWMSIEGAELNRDKIAQNLGYVPGSGAGSNRVKKAAEKLGYL